jgi:hypothetical protein
VHFAAVINGHIRRRSRERALQTTVELILQNRDHSSMSSARGGDAFFRLLDPVLFLANLCAQVDVSSHAVKQILALPKLTGSMKFHPEYSRLR